MRCRCDSRDSPSTCGLLTEPCLPMSGCCSTLLIFVREITSNSVGKAILNYPQVYHSYGWYTPSTYGIILRLQFWRFLATHCWKFSHSSFVGGLFMLALLTWLVGGLNPSEKYEFVNRDDDIPNIWENKNWCSKPPTRHDCQIQCLLHPQPWQLSMSPWTSALPASPLLVLHESLRVIFSVWDMVMFFFFNFGDVWNPPNWSHFRGKP